MKSSALIRNARVCVVSASCLSAAIGLVVATPHTYAEAGEGGRQHQQMSQGVLGKSPQELARHFRSQGEQTPYRDLDCGSPRIVERDIKEKRSRGDLLGLHRLMPLPPAVKVINYRIGNTHALAVGFDKDDKARYVFTHEAYGLERLNYRWYMARSLTSVFPVLYSGETVSHSYMVWSRVSDDLKVERPASKAAYYRVMRARPVFCTKDQSVYAFYDYWWHARWKPNGKTGDAIVADADVFWNWISEELRRQLTEGMAPNVNEFEIEERTYEQMLAIVSGALGQPQMERAVTLRRLGAAFAEMLRNPAVSDKLVENLAAVLLEEEYRAAIDEVALVLASPDAMLAKRGVGIMESLKTEKKVGAMIGLLLNVKTRTMAADSLNQLTGQDFGDDAKKWRLWWTAHKDESQQK